MAISIPIGSATITDQIQPIMTRAIDALQCAHSEPSAAMANSFEMTAVGDGRNTSCTRCP